MRLTLGIDVAAPSELAWQELVALSHWPHWGPTIRAARLEGGGDHVHAGATGSVQTSLGVWLPFQVDGCHDSGPRKSWSWRVAAVPATSHSVIARGNAGCRVEISVPWPAAAYLPVVALALRRIRRRVELLAAGWAAR